MALAFVVFMVSLAQDYAWARYTEALYRRQGFMASAWAGGLQLGGAVVVLAYVGKPHLVLVSILGAMAGTYLAVYRAKSNEGGLA